MTLTPAQLRAARALLGWSVEDLAARAGLSAETLAAGERDRPLAPSEAAAAERALEAAGVVPVPEDGGGAGVRFLHPDGAGDQGLAPDELNAANDG